MRWLASKGRMDECLDVMRSICKTNNGITLEKEAEMAVIRMVERRKKREAKGKPGWAKLFTTPGLRKNFMIMIVTW